MKVIKIDDAVGHVLAHDVTQIVPNQFKGVRFKKGHIVRLEDIEVFKSIGKEHLYILELGEDDVHENDAAQQLVSYLQDTNMELKSEVKEGKLELISKIYGLFYFDEAELLALNTASDYIVATISNYQVVKPGDKLAATRIIPLSIKQQELDKLKPIITKPLLKVLPFINLRIGLVTTGNEVYSGRIQDAFEPVIKQKLASYGASLSYHKIVSDDQTMIKQAIIEAKANSDIVLVTGGMSVDPDDCTPKAIVDSGNTLVSYGVPVLPGGMLLVAYDEAKAVIGVPSCAMYAKITALDLILPRVLAGLKITKLDLKKMGAGGLCLSCPTCTYPKCSFGK